MKRLVIALAIASALSACAYAKTPSDRLLTALIQVESSGNDKAVGDNGKAVGCLQIRKEVIDDVNRIYGTDYTLADRRDRAKSMEICRRYISHYATEKRLGRSVRNEDMARIWNGGPNGHRKGATNKYWTKVKRAMS